MIGGCLMFCQSCGKEIDQGNSFCSNCGSQVISNNEVSNNSNPPFQDISALPPQGIPQSPIQGMPELPPYTAPNNVSISPKKKSKIWIPITIGVGIFLLVLITAIILFNRFFNRLGSQIRDTMESQITIDDSSPNEDSWDDSETYIDDAEVNEENEYVITYSYAELPDVLSLDSDIRFSYVDYLSTDGVFVYTFQFNELNAGESDFLQACDDYSILLQEISGFTYEQEYTEQQYAETGILANYLTRDNYGMGITAETVDSEHYAYISIFPLVEDTVDVEVIPEDISMPNYDYFLAGRDIVEYTFDETVNMENGLSFYIYDAIANYPGDGSYTIDITLDISSYYEDYHINNGDFMLIPFDSEGSILSDAIPINKIYNEWGYEMIYPFVLSASSYEYYTLSYPIPTETAIFLLYAANVLNDDYSYPVYVMEVGTN